MVPSVGGVVALVAVLEGLGVPFIGKHSLEGRPALFDMSLLSFPFLRFPDGGEEDPAATARSLVLTMVNSNNIVGTHTNNNDARGYKTTNGNASVRQRR